MSHYRRSRNRRMSKDFERRIKVLKADEIAADVGIHRDPGACRKGHFLLLAPAN